MTENNNTQQFIQKLAQREGVSPQKIQETITVTFRNSYCQGENKEADLHFEFNTDFAVYRVYKIVEKISNPEKEITKDNKLLKGGKIEGEKFFLPLDTKNLSFSLSNEIKKQLGKNLGTVQQEKQLELFKPLQGKVIQGTVQGENKGYFVVNLGKVLGY